MSSALRWLDHRPAPVGSRFTAPATLRVAIRAGRDFPWRISPKKETKRAVAINRDPTCHGALRHANITHQDDRQYSRAVGPENQDAFDIGRTAAACDKCAEAWVIPSVSLLEKLEGSRGLRQHLITTRQHNMMWGKNRKRSATCTFGCQ